MPGLSSGLPTAPRTTTLLLTGGGASNPIDHVVILVQENHVYDNFFATYCLQLGPYCSVNATGIPAGTCVPYTPANPAAGCARPFKYPPSFVTTPVDLLHNWQSAHTAYDNGSNDGFYAAEGKKMATFGYYDGSQLPTYWDLAEQYGLGDNFYASVLSYSTPNHWYLLAGQSPAQGINQSLQKGTNQSRLTGYDETYLNQSNATESIVNLLSNSSVSWKYYDWPLTTYQQALHGAATAGAVGSAFDFWNPLASQASSYSTQVASHFVGNNQFFSDAAAGTLPNVSWVIPTFADSDHPPASLVNGEAWVASVIDAVEHSPDWNHTAVFVTWDDYGGYYDHLPPPALDAYGVSFRVPLLVVSPYARENYVSHDFEYFESLLHFIEWRFGLSSLTSRDADAPLPLEYFDFNATPRPPMAIPGPSTAHYPAALQPLGGPPAPVNLSASVGPGTVTLNWSLPAGPRTAPSGYVLTCGPAGAPAAWTLHPDASLRSVTIANLAGGVPYSFTLRSISGANSSASLSVNATALVSANGTAAPASSPVWQAFPSGSGPTPPARAGAAFAYDTVDQTVVLFGGQGAAGALLADTWEWVNGGWVQMAPSLSPPARTGASMAYDAKDGYLVLFGGQGAHGLLGDTWEFAKGAWKNVTATASGGSGAPSPRSGASASANGAALYVVLFGGLGSQGPLSDTWKFATGKWSPVSTTNHPSSRSGAAMAFDVLDNYVVLYGGQSATNTTLSDTWRFSMGAWRPITGPNNPGPREGASIAYDARDRYTVLYGGGSPGNASSGSWKFAAGQWSLLSAGTAPSPRWNAGMAYDPLHQAVLFGFGGGPVGPLADRYAFVVPASIALTASPSLGVAPLEVGFAPTVLGGMGPYAFRWSFGDGSQSALPFPTHQFTVPGSYGVHLAVVEPGGLQATANLTVQVNGRLQAQAAASAPSPNGTVAFASTVGGGVGPYHFLWLFGLAGANSTRPDPTFQYSAPGNYTVGLRVTDATGSVAYSNVSVTVTAPAQLVVTVSADETDGDVPFNASLSANVSGGTAPYNLTWSFGDGSAAAYGNTTVHRYSSAGSYTVSLRVVDSAGRNSSANLTIAAEPPLLVGFSSVSSNTSANVSFQSNVSGGLAPYQYEWLLGDGNSSATADPTHTYGAAGDYLVELVVHDAVGAQANASATVEAGYANASGTSNGSGNASGNGTDPNGSLGNGSGRPSPRLALLASAGPVATWAGTGGPALPSAPLAAARWPPAPVRPRRTRTSRRRATR